VPRHRRDVGFTLGVVIPIVTPEEMGAVDAAAADPVEVLIGRAGWAVARAALEMLDGGYGRTVNLIAGPGNNGADGRVGCEHLARRGVRVRIYGAKECPAELLPADLVIDAAFGTGFRGEWQSPEVGDTPVLAVDIPSGVNGLTGVAGPGVLAAERTITFQAWKPGLLLNDGPALAGRVDVADIGLDCQGVDARLVGRDDVATWLPRRERDSHKWRGAVKVVAGSPGMTGAAVLATAAAARAGAGIVQLVTTALADDVRAELITRVVDVADLAGAATDRAERYGSVVVGPGLGRSDLTVEVVHNLIDVDVPLLVDGDGLMAFEPDFVTAIRTDLRSRHTPVVLTPHDGEFARLTGDRVPDDRIAAVRRLASRTNCTVLLKGPTTLVAAPEGALLAVEHGDQRLATAGSGDVLSGVVGALLARGAPALQAAAGGAWIHAEAGLQWPAAGLLAGDLIDALPGVLAELT